MHNMNDGNGFFKATWHNIESHYAQKGKKSDEDIKEEVALKIELHIKAHNITQEEIAKKIGVTRMQVIRWLQKKSKPSNAAMKLLKQEGIL